MTHCQTIKRSVHLFNLDPAAERFEYEPSIGIFLPQLVSIGLSLHVMIGKPIDLFSIFENVQDIRELITLEDVMDELHYGPNGGLIYCLEFLLNNIDWLEDELGEYYDDYLIIDCPGQIELYTHFPIIRRLCECLQRMNFSICGVYLLESQFIEDKSKFFAGVLSAMSAMISLEIPHINVMSKMDLLGDVNNQMMERYFDPDPLLLLEEVNRNTNTRYHSLNEAIAQLVDDYNMVSFLPLNIRDEDSVASILSHIDNATQYGEDQEPTEPKDEYDENE
ncbi:7471_t:CDS:2 [Paraglomus brasilianum]|uniref:GPN-loop GTPase 3 n=1 Tax=Paraglomus brasilianum TaxID=144538 RepID=A0A9N9BVH5_9GLOM|nr:7471_t:CDS:2 [Paraglomus brasilianum]